MPLPLSHSLAGIGLQTAADADGPSLSVRLLLAVIVANAPDLDMLPGLLVGDPNRFHQGMSHSLAAALIAGLVGWGWYRLRPAATRIVAGGAALQGLLVAALWGSHLLLDALTDDARAPVGVPLLWPLSEGRVHIAPLFARADKLVGPGGIGEFVVSLMTRHNLQALALEALLLGPPVAFVIWWRHRRAEPSAR